MTMRERTRGSGTGQVPVLSRIFPSPVAAKVPEVIFVFWVVKVLTTAGGEATSDYLKTWGNVRGGGTEILLFVAALIIQFATRRYRAFAYWFLAYAIAIFGTGVADFLHLDVGIPYAGTSVLWAVVLALVFVLWYRSERTLSIHSVTTQRREAYYWATVFATFALGTALGDFTAMSLGLGYLASTVLFGVVILIPALAWWRFNLDGITAFWMAYVVTRPLGASIADYISKPTNTAPSPARNATTEAISSGWARRPSGIALLSLASAAGSSSVCVLMGVATAPGPTPTTRMLWGASSTPAVRVSMRMPPLDKQ
jgi:uncharacterized membrane-anchored protein